MKKFILILICLTLTVAAFVPSAVFSAEAAADVAEEQDSVHFIKPTAITVVGNCLYVADNIEDESSALLCFALNGSTSPTLKFTYEINETITGLSSNGDDIIYAICGTKIVELNLRGDDMPTIGNTYDKFGDSENVQIVSVAYGAQFRLNEDTMYVLSTDKMLYLSAEQNKFIQFTSINNLSNTKGCYILNENNSAYLYYIANNTCARFNLTSNSGDADFSNNLNLTVNHNAVTPNGIFGGRADNKEYVGLYNSNGIFKIEGSGSLQSGTLRYNAISLFKEPNEVYDDDRSIVAVETFDDALIVLNSRNQIDIFELDDNGYYKHEPVDTIGSDMVDKAVPTSYTSFTLARPKGYPANIVYKTNADSSIGEIITDADEYVILGYEGDASSHYYYVMVGDKFGWVKKSDGSSTTPENDGKLTIVDNKFGNDVYGYETKFVSLNGVYVYELPLSSSHQTEVTQTATTMKTVKVLQEFKEGDQVWYLVSFDDTTGFVKKEQVGSFHITAKPEQVVTQGLKKINSSLFAAVNLYATAELGEGKPIVDVNGDPVKLYSGDRVTLISEEGDAAFIMVLHSNGETDFGYVETSRLINVHQITTNAIVGLSLLAGAIALAAILIVVYFKRKKRIKANRD